MVDSPPSYYYYNCHSGNAGMKIEDIIKNSPETRKNFRRFWYNADYFAASGSRVIMWQQGYWNPSRFVKIRLLELAGVEYELPR